MTIKIKLFATLRQGRGKEITIEKEENPTVSVLLDELGIKREEIAILLVNGRDGETNTILNDGDTVSLFPPVGGG